MSEDAKPQQRFQIQKLYIKDLSFEIPNAPQVFQAFQKAWKPDINLQINTANQQLDARSHEVVLSLTITAKQDEQTAFLIELQQAGVFVLENFSDQHLGPTLGAFCPSVLFPYARETVDSLLLKGGFPPLQLAPVNFEALYLQRQRKQQQQPSDSGQPAPDATTH
ncbi:MAG: protein-export chaperone SecB [Candidatus Competibacterales bacterium]|nr:protein-export chaperone SecB [Candidatus Competibacterales bacterium]